jgi:hypothetical protein
MVLKSLLWHKRHARFAANANTPTATGLSRPEAILALLLLLALLLACFGPFVAQPAQYHAFADQRGWLGLPFAMDVLSNVPFAVLGVLGLWRLRQLPGAGNAAQGHGHGHGHGTNPFPNPFTMPSANRLANRSPKLFPDAFPNGVAQKPLVALFFIGLIVAAICSSIYHWQPANPSLAIDRAGMVVAFAGLLGLASAERISARAGWALTALVLLAGPACVLVWSQTGNLLPWVVLQGGGMVLLLILAFKRPVGGAWGINLGLVIALYAAAKVLEMGDHWVFDVTQGVVSGHSLKHVVAALAAWPVISAMAQNSKQTATQP